MCRREAQSAQQPSRAAGVASLSKIWLPLLLICLGVGGWFAFRDAPIQQQPTGVSPALGPEPIPTEVTRDPSFREEAKRTVARESSEAPEQLASNAVPAAAAPVASAREPTTALRRPQKPSKEDLRILRRRVEVILYVTSWCPSCRSAKAFLQTEGISYTEHDIEKDQAAAERMHRLNPEHTIPTFDIEGVTITSWSPQRIQAAMDRAALVRWKREEGLD